MADPNVPTAPAAPAGPGGSASAAPFCQVVTAIDSRVAAQELAHSVVAARLAACAQVVGPVTSVYWWRGEVQTAEEWQCVMKTTEDRYAELAVHVREHHPYEVPEILRVPVSGGNAEYLTWIRTETR